MKREGTKSVRREFGDHMTERRELGLEVGYDGNVLSLGKRDGDIEEQYIVIVMFGRGSLLANA